MPESYNQFCPMAMALDTVGHRWALLILRDLARSPLRFSDLQAINPNLSPTLLTQRLRELEASGIIERRTVRSPGKTSLYALTKTARPAVLPVLTALVELGAHVLEQGPPIEDPVATLAEQMRLNSTYVLARGLELEGYFVFDVSGSLTHVVIREGEFEELPRRPRGKAADATAVFSPPTTMVRIMGRVLTPAEAERDGRLLIKGDRDAMLELLRLLSFDGPDA